MSYSENTFKDKNKVKRWLQYQRLESALKLGCDNQSPAVICDFGAGNGELCKFLPEYYPDARIICYEPTQGFLNEARENLKTFPNIDFFQDIEDVEFDSVDIVFCLEVFEHLPLKETHNALITISNILKPNGKFVIGVPVEVGIPALYKGIFRMFRRYGAFDANIKNILLSFLYFPPKNRPSSEITPGFCFYFEHTGFDFRKLKKSLYNYFVKIRVSASPFPILGSWLTPEVYFIVEKASKSN
jgi:SAM-dependent methyltransferase